MSDKLAIAFEFILFAASNFLIQVIWSVKDWEISALLDFNLSFHEANEYLLLWLSQKVFSK